MIKEEECNVHMPNPVDDQHMTGTSNWVDPSPDMATFALSHTIHVIGGIARLLRMLKTPQLSNQTLQAYDKHFDTVQTNFPAHLQLRAQGYVDPIELPPIMYLQNTRLALHRHNLSPICDQVARIQALDHCAAAAKDTSRYLLRCMQRPPAGLPSNITACEDSWENRLISASSAFICTHLWRCTLFLLFRFDFESALVCTRASAVLGDTRRVNTSCGRYLDFFLSQFLIKLKQGIQFDADEEMIAYVSADLQSSFESSWIWQETKGNVHMGKPLQSISGGDPSHLLPDLSETTAPSTENDWAGWEKIIRLIEGLMEEQRHAAARPLQAKAEVSQPPTKHFPP